MDRPKYLMLLPLTYNDKSKVPKNVRDQILDELFVLAGGHYIGGVGKGAYRMRSGEKKIEYCLQVWVAVEEADVPTLKTMVARFAAMLGQESIYLERTGGTVEFIPPSPVGGLFT